ncbi:MAG: succinylglutamate desuccinylase/aspartoacylase family protein [Bdellovibrionales bacterium]|nr:succinylglutamate desuccinylase/aspartoacylase family protein [Bdellovibrionales bacterium]
MRFLLVATFLISSFFAVAKDKTDRAGSPHKSVGVLMDTVKNRTKPYKWDPLLFNDKGWLIGGYSVDGMPLLYWVCGDINAKNRSLVLSAVHGDEITPVYFGFRLVEWVKARPNLCKDKLIVIAPLVNPDGFLRYQRGTRTNFNKVDLNRNFPTPEWNQNAHKIWKEKYSSRRRYYPGDKAGDQPENTFQRWLINEFKITKILSIHAPLNILDYDGPISEEVNNDNFAKTYFDSCYILKENMKRATSKLRFFAYGTFPGSLGNYAGKILGIPTLTVELPTTDASKAMQYFADMEKSHQIFFDFAVEERPNYLKERASATASEVMNN